MPSVATRRASLPNLRLHAPERVTPLARYTINGYPFEVTVYLAGASDPIPCDATPAGDGVYVALRPV